MARSTNEIREDIAGQHGKAKALSNLAEKETRDLTKEEKTDFDGFLARSEVLKVDLERAEWLEKEEERLLQPQDRSGPGHVGPQRSDGPQDSLRGNSGDRPRVASIQIPITGAFRYGKLKAFHGEYADQTAYMAGQFYLATVFGHAPAADWCKEHGISTSIRDALSGGEPGKGGFLVPVEVEQAIIDLREEYGIARRKAKRSPMAGDTKDVPRRTSGVTAYFVGNNEEVTASDKAWDQVSLVARKLAALIKYSSEISEDATINIADDLTRELSWAFAVKEDQCMFIGDGTSTYGGISGLITECAAATATVVTALTANTAFSTLDLVDFESMIGKLPEYPGIDPEWYISKAGWAASMMRLADAAGGNTAEIIEGMRRRSFMGFAVNFVSVMNKVLTAQTSTDGICYFGDLEMAATFGDRRGLAIKVSSDRYLEYDQLGILGTERFDINVHDVGDTTDPGAMIMLAMPSS